MAVYLLSVFILFVFLRIPSFKYFEILLWLTPSFMYFVFVILFRLMASISDEEKNKKIKGSIEIISIIVAALFLFSLTIAVDETNDFIFDSKVNATIENTPVFIEGNISYTTLIINLTNNFEESLKGVNIKIVFNEYVNISDSVNCNDNTLKKTFNISVTDNETWNDVELYAGHIRGGGNTLFYFYISWGSTEETPTGKIDIEVNTDVENTENIHQWKKYTIELE